VGKIGKQNSYLACSCIFHYHEFNELFCDGAIKVNGEENGSRGRNNLTLLILKDDIKNHPQ